jgi:tetratricopeptide (TPR) repeat protein
VVVVVVALAIGLIAGSDSASTQVEGGSLASAVTGTTDHITGADMGGSPSISTTPGRQEPSRKQWEEILPKLQAIVEASPDDVNALRKLALAHYNLGRFSDAADTYKRLLALKEDAVLRNRLGNTLRDMDDATGAEAAYRKAISDDATLAAPYINLAELLWRQGKDAAAVDVLDQGVKAVPEESRESLQKARQVLSTEEGGGTT